MTSQFTPRYAPPPMRSEFSLHESELAGEWERQEVRRAELFAELQLLGRIERKQPRSEAPPERREP